MVIMLMCVLGPAPHVVRGQKTLQMHGFLYKYTVGVKRSGDASVPSRSDAVAPFMPAVRFRSVCTHA